MARPASDWQRVAQQKARKYGLDPSIFARQIRQESGFNPGAVSPAGAVGIAQIMPATARGWGVNPRDPNAALDAAARHMAQYVKQFGSYKDALVAYNAGPGAVGRSSLPAETQNYIKSILGGRDPGTSSVRAASTHGAGKSSGGGGGTRTTTTITPGVDNSQARAALVQSFLGNKNADVLDFALQARDLQDVPETRSTQTVRLPGGGGTGGGASGSSAGGGGGLAQIAARRADVIDRQQLPYQWGGGHGGMTKISDPVPLDCSGAVSKVLGINPRVSGEFGRWGRPGDGGDRGVTIYSNGHHVLMKINGHFFGTSATNPGGGAGWIPQGAISKDYLRGFTARHSNR